MIDIEQDRNEFSIQRQVDDVRQEIESQFLYLANLAQVLAFSAVENQTQNSTVFQRMAKNIIQNAPYINSVILTKDNIISHIYPYKKYAKKLGHHYPDTTEEEEKIILAKVMHLPTLLGPIKYKDKPSGMVFYTPIYNGKKNNIYWGVIAMELNLKKFLDYSGFFHQDNLTLALLKKDKTPLYGQHDIFWTKGHAVQPIKVHNIKLYVGGVRTKSSSTDILQQLRIIGVFIAFIIASLFYSLLRSYETIHHQSLHDPLTSLPNLRWFHMNVESFIEYSKRKNSTFSILFIDVNKFKLINDSFGHRVGDLVLQKVATRMRKELRESDIISRVGGDEFVILLKDTAQKSDVQTVIRKLKTVVNKTIIAEGTPLDITISIGHCFYPKEGKTTTDLIKIADQKMYLDKQSSFIT